MVTRYNTVLSIPLEGWAVLALLVGLAALINAAGAPLLALLALGGVLPLVYFFGDRRRRVPAHARGVLAPVDGVVVHRRECHDPVLGREAIRIGIRVDPWGAYSLRSPVEGEVVEPPPGAQAARASVIVTDEGDAIVLRAAGGMLGARPVFAPWGERLGQGRRCGLRRLAREFDLFLPASARVEVPLGARVRCGETLIATILRKSA